MAETGIMGSSGEYRNNSRNTGGGAAGGSLIGQAANMISRHGEKQKDAAERLSAAQWTAIGQVTTARIQSKAQVKVAKRQGKTQVKVTELQNQNAEAERTNALELEKTKGQQKRSNIRAKGAQIAKLGETFQPGTRAKLTQGKTVVEGTLKKTTTRKPRTTPPKGK